MGPDGFGMILCLCDCLIKDKLRVGLLGYDISYGW